MCMTLQVLIVPHGILHEVPFHALPMPVAVSIDAQQADAPAQTAAASGAGQASSAAQQGSTADDVAERPQPLITTYQIATVSSLWLMSYSCLRFQPPESLAQPEVQWELSCIVGNPKLSTEREKRLPSLESADKEAASLAERVFGYAAEHKLLAGDAATKEAVMDGMASAPLVWTKLGNTARM